MKKIKRNGFATMNNDTIEIILEDESVVFSYHDIKNYTLSFNQNIALVLEFKNENSVSIVSSSSFCETSKFELFCREFECEILKRFSEEPIKKENPTKFFEKKWFRAFLVILTLSFGILLVIAIATGTKISSAFFIALSAVITLWVRYSSFKKE
ncbi:hypothetical protein [Flavobacterium sp.]|uniref:hypothetical protein n=1 Tax=Flavobacterium sp. TaxID=239 RepID=UPI003B9A6F30